MAVRQNLGTVTHFTTSVGAIQKVLFLVKLLICHIGLGARGGHRKVCFVLRVGEGGGTHMDLCVSVGVRRGSPKTHFDSPLFSKDIEVIKESPKEGWGTAISEHIMSYQTRTAAPNMAVAK